MSIRLENIEKSFGRFQAIEPLSLNIHNGEMIGLLGPSGSGKTTLLRIIAGLEGSDRGSIHFNDRDVTNVHVRDRRVGFVFQNYALFRHMTVTDNIAFGLEVMEKHARPSKAEINQRVADLLEIIQLGHLAHRYPEQLSGGQKQRVSLARALATKPEILLLDEPFGALDSKVRKDLRRWLRTLHNELGFTSVFVTHDQDEALELSDRVVVMSNGKIEQVDDPVSLYAKPNSQFVFDFFGNVNVFKAQYQDDRWLQGDAFLLAPNQSEFKQSGGIYVRGHELSLATKPNSQASLPFEIISINPVGAEVRIELSPLGWQTEETWEAKLSHVLFAEQGFKKDQQVFASPQVGYFFAEKSTTEPVVIRWPFVDKDNLNFEI